MLCYTLLSLDERLTRAWLYYLDLKMAEDHVDRATPAMEDWASAKMESIRKEHGGEKQTIFGFWMSPWWLKAPAELKNKSATLLSCYDTIAIR